MPRKVLIALMPAMLEEVDFVAKHEHRTRSDLIREALRRYLEAFREKERQLTSVHIQTGGENERQHNLHLLQAPNRQL